MTKDYGARLDNSEVFYEKSSEHEISDDEERDIGSMVDQSRPRGGSDSSGGTETDPSLNNPILLYVSPFKKEGKIKVLFSKQRADKILGEKQGDHVTSHRLFIELISRKLTDAKISDIPTILLDVMDNIIPEFSGEGGIYYLEKDDLKKAIFPSDLIKEGADNGRLDFLKDKFELGDRQERVAKLDQFLSSLLRTYNKQPDVSYVRRDGGQGDKGKSEGSVTEQSVASIQAINEFLEISKIADDAEKTGRQKALLVKLLAKNGEYNSGAKMLFDDIYKQEKGFSPGGIGDIRELFNIPKAGLEKEEIEKRLSSDYKGGGQIPSISYFVSLVNISSSDCSLVARLFDNCFDFNYTSYDYSLASRTSHERVRDRDKSSEQKLYELSARHIAIISNTFPGLADFIQDGFDTIVNHFAQLLHGNHGWSEFRDNSTGDAISSEQIFNNIKDRLDVGMGFCKVKSGTQDLEKTLSTLELE